MLWTAVRRFTRWALPKAVSSPLNIAPYTRLGGDDAQHQRPFSLCLRLLHESLDMILAQD